MGEAQRDEHRSPKPEEAGSSPVTHAYGPPSSQRAWTWHDLRTAQWNGMRSPGRFAGRAPMGPWRRLVARCCGTTEVAGSNPAGSTWRSGRGTASSGARRGRRPDDSGSPHLVCVAQLWSERRCEISEVVRSNRTADTLPSEVPGEHHPAGGSSKGGLSNWQLTRFSAWTVRVQIPSRLRGRSSTAELRSSKPTVRVRSSSSAPICRRSSIGRAPAW
jgi:hypothetical protein